MSLIYYAGKLKLFKACVASVMVYRSETWPMGAEIGKNGNGDDEMDVWCHPEE